MNATKKFRDPVSKHINKNRTHYLKWCLTDDISVRYHYLHQNNRELEGQFILKLHSKSSYQLLDRNFAKQFIHSFRKDDFNMTSVDPHRVSDFELVEPDYEIFGALRPDKSGKLQYHKTIVNLSTLHTESFFEVDTEKLDKDLSELSSSITKTGMNILQEIVKNSIIKDLEKGPLLSENRVVANDKVYFDDGHHVHRIPEEDKLLGIEDHLIIYVKNDNNFMENNVFHLSINDRENKSFFPAVRRCDISLAKDDFLNALKVSNYSSKFDFDKFGELQFLCNIDDITGIVGNNESNVYIVEYKTDDVLELHDLTASLYTTTFEFKTMEHLIKNPDYYIPNLNMKKIWDNMHSYFETEFELNKTIKIDEPTVQETIRDIAVELNLVGDKFLNVKVDDIISNNTVKCELILNREMFDSEKIVYLYVSEFIGQNVIKIVAIEDEEKYRLPTLMIPIKQDTSLFNTVPYSVVDLNETYTAEFLCSKADKADKKLLVTYYIRYLPSDEWDLDLYSQNIEKSKFLDIYLFNNILETSNDLKNVQNEVANYIAEYKSNVNQ